MPNDPIAELVSRWEKEAADTLSRHPDISAHILALMRCYPDQLRTAMQTRPRGSAEQVVEIERLKDHVLKLRLACVKFRSAYALSELHHELLDDADKTAAKYYEETK